MNQYYLSLSPDIDRLLGKLALDKGVTRGEIIRRAVAVYAYLLNETYTKDVRVSIIDLNDEVVKEINLP